MDYVTLGATGLKVSRICLGTMTFGEANEKSAMHKVGCDEATSHALLDRAFEAGVTFVDTADVYGQDGLSERILGRWFENTGHRDDIVLATKFRFTMGKGPNRKGASRYRIVRTVEESLRRLKTDRIDLYQIHMQDLDTPEEETLRALDDLVRQGKVLYIGASNYTAHRLMESLWMAERHRTERFVALQAHYNLCLRDIERELVPISERHGLGILPWSPLASGLLTGKYSREDSPEGSRLAEKSGWTRPYEGPAMWDIVETTVAIARELGATPAQVAIAWLLRKPAVASVIIGVRTHRQLEDNLGGMALELPDEAMARLDGVSELRLGYPYDFCRQVQGRH